MKNSSSGLSPLYHPRLKWLVMGLVVLAVVITGVQMKLSTHAATPTTLYTSAATSVPLGTNFTVAVRLNTDAEPINVVSGEFTYTASKFQFVSADVVGGAFTTVVESSGANGLAKIVVSTAGGAPAITGDNLVANLTFKTIASGTGTIGVTNTSMALSSNTNTNILTTYTGSTINVPKSTKTTGKPAHR